MTSREPKERLFRFDDPERPRRIVIEDDGRVAYAYLFCDDEIVSDVWLYNVGSTPSTIDWSNREELPFLNPAPFCDSTRSLPRLSKHSSLRCEWREDEVLLFLDDLELAKLQRGAKPGWSRLAIKDGPLAKRLPPDEGT